MLEGIFKGLILWLYGLVLEGVQQLANSLLKVFSLDLATFERYAPIILDIADIFVAVGWALLIGNLAFQAMRSMVAGLGVDAEDPHTLFLRTFLFGFLLLASPQICRMGLTLTGQIIDLLKLPDSVVINTPDANYFPFDSSWLFSMIVGIVIIFNVIKLFFEIGERYVIVAILSYMAPIAFAMGGSKSTEDIFRGWCRMFASMCFVMTSNVVFIKLLLSAMSTVPSAIMLFPWLIFIVAISKVARRVDDLICRIGLNPAHTGGGRGVGGLVAAYTVRAAVSAATKTTAAAFKGRTERGGNGGSTPDRGGKSPPYGPPQGGSPRPSHPGGGGASGLSQTGLAGAGAPSFNGSAGRQTPDRGADADLDIFMSADEAAALHKGAAHGFGTHTTGAPAVAGSEAHPAEVPAGAERVSPRAGGAFRSYTKPPAQTGGRAAAQNTKKPQGPVLQENPDDADRPQAAAVGSRLTPLSGAPLNPAAAEAAGRPDRQAGEGTRIPPPEPPSRPSGGHPSREAAPAVPPPMTGMQSGGGTGPHGPRPEKPDRPARAAPTISHKPQRPPLRKPPEGGGHDGGK